MARNHGFSSGDWHAADWHHDEAQARKWDRLEAEATQEETMKPVATTMMTPAGIRKAPAHPLFAERLAQCETNEDLFRMVRVDGLVDPDAINEVEARGLYGEYCEWKRQEER